MTDLRLKCTEFDFGWGSAPDLAGGIYSAPPDPLYLAGFRGRFATGEWLGLGRGGKRGGKGGGEMEGREREGPKLLLNQGPTEPCYATACVHRKLERMYVCFVCSM